MRLSVECMICHKSIEIEIDSEDYEKLLRDVIEKSKERVYELVISNISDNTVELYGFICEDCLRKLKDGI